MGMKQNWDMFVEQTKLKAESHMKEARYWDKIDFWLNLILIFFSAATTVLALLKLPSLITAGISAVTTLLSAVVGFLQPSTRRQTQLESSKEFRTLMMRMVRCETERQYEELWNVYNKAVLSEPFLPKKFAVTKELEYTMTPELTIVISEKEVEVERQLGRSNDNDDDEAMQLLDVVGDEDEGEETSKTLDPRTDKGKDRKVNEEKEANGHVGAPTIHT